MDITSVVCLARKIESNRQKQLLAAATEQEAAAAEGEAEEKVGFLNDTLI